MDMNGPAPQEHVVDFLKHLDPDNCGQSRGAHYLSHDLLNKAKIVSNLDLLLAAYYDASEINDGAMQELADNWGDRSVEEFESITGHYIGEFR